MPHQWAGRIQASADCLPNNILPLLSAGIWLQTCVGSEPAGEWAATPNGDAKRYLHSPSSLKALLQHIGFSQVNLSSPPLMNICTTTTAFSSRCPSTFVRGIFAGPTMHVGHADVIWQFWKTCQHGRAVCMCRLMSWDQCLQR